MKKNNSKIKILLVTGFLGSGKTTLINRLIDFYKSKKIALIVNDFGKIVVDGILLRNQLDNQKSTIYEIANGSIFCTCLSAELVKSLNFFINEKPETVIIETSGLSDPSTFQKILSENNLDDFYTIENSICIVDSKNVLQLSNKILAIEKQILSSKIILINKNDLISDKEYKKIEEFVKSKNKNSFVIKSKYAEFDLQLLNNNQSLQFSNDAVTCNTVSTRPGSILLNQKKITQNEIKEFYNNIGNNILRIKGFLKIGSVSYYISDNNKELQIKKFDKSKIQKYGLSVLLEKKYVDLVKSEWNKFENTENKIRGLNERAVTTISNMH